MTCHHRIQVKYIVQRYHFQGKDKNPDTCYVHDSIFVMPEYVTHSKLWCDVSSLHRRKLYCANNVIFKQNTTY